MRKSLIGVVCCFVVLVWALPADAQTAGLKAGRVWANLDGETGDPGTTLERKSGWAGGAFVRFALGPVALQPEVLYVQRGAAVKGSGASGSPELRMNFIEVPVLLRLGSAGTSLYGGGYGALKTDAKTVDDSGEIDVSSEFEDFDYGVVVGISMGFGKFEVEGRYSYGLRNLVKDPGAPELKNRTFMLLGSLSF